MPLALFFCAVGLFRLLGGLRTPLFCLCPPRFPLREIRLKRYKAVKRLYALFFIQRRINLTNTKMLNCCRFRLSREPTHSPRPLSYAERGGAVSTIEVLPQEWHTPKTFIVVLILWMLSRVSQAGCLPALDN